MGYDRLSPFLGKPIRFNGVNVYSPTIEQIESIGEMQYRLNLLLATFDKEKILLDIYRMKDEDYEKVESFDDFEFLVSDFQMTQMISQAISFFVDGDVKYSIASDSLEFINEDKRAPFVDRNNYKDFVELMRFLNGLESKKEKIEFKNERVKKKYKEMLKLKKKHEKPSEFELKDVLSVLCNSDGNGVSIFNVSRMTVYQVYEHFERINVKDNHLRTLALWANTYTLKEGTKLPEWIVKTKY